MVCARPQKKDAQTDYDVIQWRAENIGMRFLLYFAAALGVMCGTQGGLNAETNVYECPGPVTAERRIDQLVFPQLERAGVTPVLCSDAVFVRRVYLDLLGTLPTAEEARDFIRNPDEKNKRRILIDRLLERKEFADYWSMKWGDVLRIKAEFPVNLWPNAAQAYHHWIWESIFNNKPYDRFAREMLTANGSNFRVGPVNFYRAIQNRAPEDTARAVALTFMGARAENWPSNRLANMAVFFSQIGYKPTGEWKEELVFWNPLGLSNLMYGVAGRASIAPIPETLNANSNSLGGAVEPGNAFFPDGSLIQLKGDRDPRVVFADWLIREDNPYFNRAIANRIWAWLMGRGIVQEPDDLREDNPPSNPALMAYLERSIAANHYDLKRFYRLILNSKTYQLSSLIWMRGDSNAVAQLPGYRVRRLEAEVIIDSVNKVAGAADLYTSPIPEPFTYIPKGNTAVSIADGSITSASLALFGRSARATGLENERDNKPTPAQWLYLLNSSDMKRKLEQGTNLDALLSAKREPSEIRDDLYLAILSRFPTEQEAKNVEDYVQFSSVQKTAASPKKENQTKAPAKKAQSDGNEKQKKPADATKNGMPQKTRNAWIDIAWALINSEEFIYRH
jgi:hypothetical protein